MLMCVFLFLLWLIFNGRVTLEICLFGIVVTGLVYAFLRRRAGVSSRNERRVLRRLGRYLQYGVTLVWGDREGQCADHEGHSLPQGCLPPCRGAAAGAAGGGQLPCAAVQLHHP